MKAQFLVLVLLLGVCSCQNDDGCDSVDEGLNPVLAACRESPSSCVTQEDQDFSLFSGLFCNDRAMMAFNNFERCTNRTFVDQVFGAICGNVNCTVDDAAAFADCQTTENRCFETVPDNDGTAAFAACMCSNESQSATTPTCSDECRMELELLTSDVGCCVDTSIYVYYFSTCGDLGVNPDLGVLSRLYASCGIDLPATCLHPFSIIPTVATTEGAPSTASAFSILVFFTVLSLVVID